MSKIKKLIKSVKMGFFSLKTLKMSKITKITKNNKMKKIAKNAHFCVHKMCNFLQQKKRLGKTRQVNVAKKTHIF